MAFIVDVEVAGTGGGAGPTADVDTTGADLIVAAIHHATGATIAFGDNKSNTYTGLTARVGSVSGVQLYYKLSPTVGTGHNFTVTGSNIYAVISVAAFSGITGFDKEAGTTASSSTTCSPGSVTPAANNAVLFTAVTGDVANFSPCSVGSSFTKTSDIALTGNNMGGAAGYKIQTTAGAENPTWTHAGSVNSLAVAIAVFTGTGGGGPTAFPWTNLYRQYSA